jgi:hypothetical protein
MKQFIAPLRQLVDLCGETADERPKLPDVRNVGKRGDLSPCFIELRDIPESPLD